MRFVFECIHQNTQDSEYLVCRKYEYLQKLVAQAIELHHEIKLHLQKQKLSADLFGVAQKRFSLNPRKYCEVIMTIGGLVR